MKVSDAQLLDPEGGRSNLGWMSIIGLCTVLGLGSVWIADASSRLGNSVAPAFFWLGLLLIFTPIAFRVLSNNVDRNERLALVVLLGVALYLVKFFGSPDAFTFVDEYIHLRSTQDILRTQHVFTFNPLLPTAAYYPGLAAVTAGLVDLTGLSPFMSGVLIIGAARILISTCFFLVAERVTGSARAAAGASLVYAANPMFLFWSSTFSYEDLALPLAAFVVCWLARVRREVGYAQQTITLIAIVAVTVTHHVVGFALAALLSAWWVAERFTRRPSSQRRTVGFMSLVSITAALTWLLFVARPAATYLLADNLFPALKQTASELLGHATHRILFASGGYSSPLWEMVVGYASIELLLLALPPALYVAWTRRGRTSVVVAAIVAVVYPLSLVPRFVPNGVAISGRSSEYVFTGLACLLGLLTAEATGWRRSRRRLRPIAAALASGVLGRRGVGVAAGLTTVVFAGGVIIGTAFYERLPEPSHPQGYPWSVQPDVVRASVWARERFGINQRFAASTIDASALGTYGEQDPASEDSIWPIFFAETMDDTVVQSIRSSGVRYLLVDWRMTDGVPPTPGYYFSPQEPHAGDYHREPFSASALQKFVSDPCTRLIYDSGFIQIFDVSLIQNGSCVPGRATLARGSTA